MKTSQVYGSHLFQRLSCRTWWFLPRTVRVQFGHFVKYFSEIIKKNISSNPFHHILRMARIVIKQKILQSLPKLSWVINRSKSIIIIVIVLCKTKPLLLHYKLASSILIQTFLVALATLQLPLLFWLFVCLLIFLSGSNIASAAQYQTFHPTTTLMSNFTNNLTKTNATIILWYCIELVLKLICKEETEVQTLFLKLVSGP